MSDIDGTIERAEAWLRDSSPYWRPPQELFSLTLTELKAVYAENERLKADNRKLSGEVQRYGCDID